MLSYIFGGDAPAKTPEDLKRQREIAQALLGLQTAPRNVGEGLNALGGGIASAILSHRADRAEKAGLGSADADYAPIVDALGGGGAFLAAPGSGAPSSNPDLSAAPITGPVFQPFIDTVKAGGVTNPYALAAVAATGRAESAFSPKNANRTWNDGENNAGGIMSLNGARLANLQNFVAANGGQGLGTPELQAQYFLKENPELIASLNNAKSVEEALGLMNNAWRFKGYNDPNSKDAARRLTYAKGYLPQFNVPGVDAAPVDAVNALAGGQPNLPPAPAAAPAAAPASTMPTPAPVGARDRLVPAQPPLADANFLSRFGGMQSPASPGPAAPPPFSLGAAMPFSAQPPQMQPPAAPVQVVQNVNPNQMSDTDALAALGARPVQPGRGASIADLLKAAGNPWMNKNRSAVVSALLANKLKQQDPENQLDMRYKQAQLDNLLNPPVKPTSDMQNYEFYTAQERAAGHQPLSYNDWNLQSKKAGATQINNNVSAGGDFSKQLQKNVADDVLTERTSAQDAADLIKIINEGRGLLDQGAITGAGANYKVGALKFAGALGIPIPQDAADNTQAFRAVMGQAVGKIIKQFGSGTGLSDADRQYAERIAGGDVTLNEEAIRRILDIADKGARGRIKAWQTKLPEIMKGDLNSMLDVQMPGEYQAPTANGGPQPGRVEDGYRFKGGNPSDPNSWEPVQ